MDTYTAISIIEGSVHEEDRDLHIQAWQHLIDTGEVWELQGWYGRTALWLIEEGLCKKVT